jgi:hypothetical protein
VRRYGPANWDILAKHLKNRTGKQCCERFHNILDPNIRKGDWEPEEDKKILELHEVFGNQWAKIARHLQGRTDNSVKNRWHALSKFKRGKGLYDVSAERAEESAAQEINLVKAQAALFENTCAPL